MADSKLTSLFTDIASAIREKNGSTDKIMADSFPNAIRGIVSGDVNEMWKKIADKSFTEANHQTITKVGTRAFINCTKLSLADFPLCTDIGSYAFDGCTNLAYINFPECTKIGIGAFQSCKSLDTAYFPKCSKIIYNAFNSCTNLSSINFPVCVDINASAFKGCINITTVSFPMCTNISSYAFNGCQKLSEIYLGASQVCTLNNSNAFNRTPYTGYSSYFSGTPYIYVPHSLINSYKIASNWSYFSSYFSGAIL